MARTDSAKTTLPEAIRDDLAIQIRTGVLPAGSPLPKFAELCAHYHTSRFSVNAALRLLESDKLIQPRTRRPALVRKASPLPRQRAVAIFLPFPVEDFHYASSPQGWMFYQTMLAEVMNRQYQCVTLRTDCSEAAPNGLIGGIVLLRGKKEPFLPQHIPLIHLRSLVDGSAVNTVYLRHRNGMLQSALYFLSHGVKSVLQWGVTPAMESETSVFFRKTLLERGLAPDALRIHAVQMMYAEPARESVKEFLATRPELPLGILTGGDFNASGAVQACLEAGLRLKEDFFVIGITDLPETARWHPAVSVQSVPYQELAAGVLDMLGRRIASGCDQPPEFIDNKLIIRET